MAARTVPTMPDWTSHEVTTSALLEQITTWNRFWANPPMFRMFQTIAQPTVANATDTQITMDGFDYDTDSGRALTSPWSYTIPVGMTGRWQLGVNNIWAGNGTGSRQSKIFKNGVLIPEAYAAVQAGPAATATGVQIVDTFSCAAGDVIAAYGYQSSGGTLSTQVSPLASCFWGRLVSLATP